MAQNLPKVRHRLANRASPYLHMTHRARVASAYPTLFTNRNPSLAARTASDKPIKISLSDILQRHIYSSLRSAREIVKFFTKSGRVTNEAYHMAQILLKVRSNAKITGDAARQRQRRQLLVGFA